MRPLSKIDVEFAHIYLSSDGSVDEDDLASARESAELAAEVVAGLRERGHRVTTSSLVDDYTYRSVSVSSAVAALNSLTMTPDSAWREGDLVDAAEQLLGRVRRRSMRMRGERRSFLVEGRDLTSLVESTGRAPSLLDVVSGRATAEQPQLPPDRFRFALNFDIDVPESDGLMQLACPVLAAAWQAVRLGLIEAPLQDVFAQDPGDSFPADLTVSILPVEYVQVEASVRALLSACGDEGRSAAGRIRYVFF